MPLTVNQIKDMGEKIKLLEQDMQQDQLWGTRDGPVTTEQLINYARSNPHILEMVSQVAEMLERQ